VGFGTGCAAPAAVFAGVLDISLIEPSCSGFGTRAARSLRVISAISPAGSCAVSSLIRESAVVSSG